jgi:hypothetical protein
VRRKVLRDLEAQIGEGIKLFTIDRDVFYGKYEHLFPHSQEKFPVDEDGEFGKKRIKGGTTKIEAHNAGVFLVLWVVLLVWAWWSGILWIYSFLSG